MEPRVVPRRRHRALARAAKAGLDPRCLAAVERAPVDPEVGAEITRAFDEFAVFVGQFDDDSLGRVMDVPEDPLPGDVEGTCGDDAGHVRAGARMPFGSLITPGSAVR
jgi:hypothetical protein